jgi:hypothetical protein
MGFSQSENYHLFCKVVLICFLKIKKLKKLNLLVFINFCCFGGSVKRREEKRREENSAPRK